MWDLVSSRDLGFHQISCVEPFYFIFFFGCLSTFLKTIPYLLWLFKRMLQHCFYVKYRNVLWTKKLPLNFPSALG